MLNRDDILNVQDIEVEKVPVPEWGKGKKEKEAFVFVKGMTGLERDMFESTIVQGRGKNTNVNMANIRAKLAALTVCDDKGERIFTDADVKALGKKSASALQRIFEVAQRLSGISKADVQELAEEMEADPFEDSPSD